MLKKVAKALDEMAKNEELMEGILAAAVGMDDPEEDRVGGGMIEQPEDEEGDERLGTIGEDGDEDKQIYDTQQHKMQEKQKKIKKSREEQEEGGTDANYGGE
jgi:hypothetical protein